MWPFIKDIINPGGGGLPKDDLNSYLISLFSKRGGGQNLKKLMTPFINGPLLKKNFSKAVETIKLFRMIHFCHESEIFKFR